MRITVTKSDIAAGRYNVAGAPSNYRERYCPVGVAFGRRGIVAYVCIEHVQIDGRGLPLPKKAIDWIAAFDRGDRTIEPFWFDVPLPA
jgi:hypothetical protein